MLNLDEIRAVTDEATHGEWKAGGCPRRINKDLQSVYVEIGCYDGQIDICRDVDPANAAFIASARQWVPALCDEVEADRKRIAELEKTIEKACEYLADTNASKVDWAKYFAQRAREEMEK